MSNLQSAYIEALSTRFNALKAARKVLDKSPEEEGWFESVETIIRIAHNLKGSGTTFGFPEITDSSIKVLGSEMEDLKPAVDNLLETLSRNISPAIGKKTKVLVVDDDPSISALLKQRLTTSIREVFVAENAAQAEELLHDNQFAMIILDLVLPDADGRTFLSQLRERPAFAGIPVIVVSSKVSRETKIECFALGAMAYFEKPFDVDELATAVASRIQYSTYAMHEARTDALTGLPNRAAYTDHFERVVSHATRHGNKLIIGIIQVDNHDEIIAKYGRPTGDEVLNHLAFLFRNNSRRSDYFARWGGDEFVVLFQDIDLKNATIAMENLLDRVREENFSSHNDQKFKVTFSAGLTDVNLENKLRENMAEADTYLFRAKKSGKNQIQSSFDEKEIPPQLVFVAEDDKLIASVVKHRLEREGLVVRHFENGKDAYDSIGDNDVKLFLIDVQMPVMDGFELLSKIRQTPRFKKVPVIMLTALGKEKDIVRGFDCGASDYITKPFSPIELLARIRRLLV